MRHISANADGEAHSDQMSPQQQQQHVELQPGASKHQTAEFFLWTFKIEPCRADYPHNWSLCPYVHPNEKARRRDPRLFEYEPLPCPDDKKGTTCPKGELCNYTHNIYEYWCHPKRFRTQVCQLGGACNRPICFFAHTAQELRRVDQPVHIPPTMTRHPVTAPGVDRSQGIDSYAAAALVAAAVASAQQQAWQANAAAGATGQYQQQQIALQGLMAQQRAQQQQQLAMMHAARAGGLANAAHVQQQIWQQQQQEQLQQQQYQSAQAAAAASQYMAVQQALAQQQQQQQLTQQRPAMPAAANARLNGHGAAAGAGLMGAGGGSRFQQQQQAAVLAQIQALVVSPTADMAMNSNLSSTLSSRRSSSGMPNPVMLEPPPPPIVPPAAAAAAVVPPAVPGLPGPPGPLVVPAAAVRLASGGVASPLAQYASGRLARELSGGLAAALPAGAVGPTVAQQQLLALEAAAALATASSGGGLVALPQQLPLSPGDAQSLITDPASLLWAAQNACSNGDNEAVPGGIANADLAGAAAAGGGLPGRFAYVQGPNSNPNSNFLLQGAGPGMPASSASSNMGSASMGALSLAGSGSGGSNIMATQLAAATGGTGRGLLLQQQQAAEVELLQAAMQQMGVGNSRYLQIGRAHV